MEEQPSNLILSAFPLNFQENAGKSKGLILNSIKEKKCILCFAS